MSTAVAPKLPGANCGKCPARGGKLVPPEPAKGRARLAIVGEAPGQNELRLGRPFIGASGGMLCAGLETLGLARRDVHWTNAVPCEVSQREQPAARKACAERLRLELRECGARVVMPVGGFGLHSAMGGNKRPSILAWRGSVNPVRLGPEAPITYVCPTVHPAFTMRADKWKPVLEIDVARIGRVLDEVESTGRWLPPEERDGRRIVIGRDERTLERELPNLGAEVGDDVETVGLGPTRTALVCLALSDGMTTVVIPWAKASNGREPWWQDPRGVAQLLTRCLGDRLAVTHNGPAFDHIVQVRYGIHVSAWGDTLLASHALESHMPKNLAHCVTQGLDVTAWKQQEDRGADIERLWIYNARDTLYTILRWQQLKKELAA